MTPEQFLDYIKAQVRLHGSQKALAEKCGMHAPYLSDILRGNREPGPTLTKALGFRKVISYESLMESEREA